MTDIVERLRKRDEYDRVVVLGHLNRPCGLAKSLEHQAAAEIERLRKALRQAIDCVEHWGAYADSYSIAKYDLAGDLRDLRAALGEGAP